VSRRICRRRRLEVTWLLARSRRLLMAHRRWRLRSSARSARALNKLWRVVSGVCRSLSASGP